MSPRKAPAVRVGGHELSPDDPVLVRARSEHRAQYLARRHELAPLPPVAERSLMGERAWQRQVVELARRLGWWVYHPQLSRWSEQGWPDLSLLHAGQRRALWVECKTDRSDLTEQQVDVIDMMLACGLEVHVFRPWHGLERVAQVLQP